MNLKNIYEEYQDVLKESFQEQIENSDIDKAKTTEIDLQKILIDKIKDLFLEYGERYRNDIIDLFVDKSDEIIPHPKHSRCFLNYFRLYLYDDGRVSILCAHSVGPKCRASDVSTILTLKGTIYLKNSFYLTDWLKYSKECSEEYKTEYLTSFYKDLEKILIKKI